MASPAMSKSRDASAMSFDRITWPATVKCPVSFENADPDPGGGAPDGLPNASTTERKARATTYHYATHNAAFGVNMPAYDLTGRLGEITCPTLVVVGRHDWRTPVSASEDIARRIPNAELVVFEESGHSPQLEEPEKFQAVVRDFLRRAGESR